MDTETKVTREQFLTFLKTGTNKWGLLGTGITEYGIAFNPQIETEKWIIHKNATSTLDSNQKQGDITQKIYKGDACFDYVYSLMDKIGSDVESEVLDVDAWNGTGDVYPAKKSKVIIAINNYMGEDASIEYSIYYNGDPEEGTVQITDGEPTFTKAQSV